MFWRRNLAVTVAYKTPTNMMVGTMKLKLIFLYKTLVRVLNAGLEMVVEELALEM